MVEQQCRAHGALDARRAGILLHVTSLPGPYDQGVLGADACRFVDFLADCECSVWQVLPLGPVHGDRSPYLTQSAHAGEPSLIDPQPLVERGWLSSQASGRGSEAMAGVAVGRAAYRGFLERGEPSEHAALAHFRESHANWLEDYALFATIRAHLDDAPWWQWPSPLRDREPGALGEFVARNANEIEARCFEQYVFFQQWNALRRYASQRGILLFGDIPIFVAQDSADVWAERVNFQLDANGCPSVVAGVPPDYFSETGQRWGNPHYDWARLKRDDYAWWKRRIASALELYDFVRIDHFRGFAAYWAIPAGAATAVDGHWLEGPGADFFTSLERDFGKLPIVVEDLGYITDDVHALREQFGFPGMKVMQFAFDGDDGNPHLPQNHATNSVVYSATHDNDTTVGWLASLADEERTRVRERLGCAQSAALADVLIEATLGSRAKLAMLPLQDVLRLGSHDRMNTPGVAEGNWRWRFAWEQIALEHESALRDLVLATGRATVS